MYYKLASTARVWSSLIGICPFSSNQLYPLIWTTFKEIMCLWWPHRQACQFLIKVAASSDDIFIDEGRLEIHHYRDLASVAQSKSILPLMICSTTWTRNYLARPQNEASTNLLKSKDHDWLVSVYYCQNFLINVYYPILNINLLSKHLMYISKLEGLKSKH